MLLLIIHQVREEFYRLEKRFNIQFNGNYIYALSHYLIHRSQQGPFTMSNEKSRLLEDFLAQKYPLLYRFYEEILTALALKLDIGPWRIDLLPLALWLHKNGAIGQQQVTRAIILAHDYATASNIASVADRLLKSQLFESFDMPLDVTPETIASQVMAWIESHALASGSIILVDMGLLNAIHRHFNCRLSTPIAIINNVPTGMAVYVGERILQGVMLEDITHDIGDNLVVEHQLYYPQTDKPRVILTTCATGLDTAANLSTLLKASIPEALGIDIVVCDVETLANPARRQPILSHYRVSAIVGTLDPQLVDLPWISLDSLIFGQDSRPLMRIFGELASPEQVSEINNLILKNFPLRRVIESVTILDTAEVINQVEQFLLRYEHLAGCDVPNDHKVALHVHISCLIGRLIRSASPSHYSGRQCPQSELATLHEAFSVIESGYGVKIPVVEFCYIRNILMRETEFIQKDQEFQFPQFVRLCANQRATVSSAPVAIKKAVECAFEVRMKRYYIFAGHGTFVNGLLNSVELIPGKQPGIHTLCAYVEEESGLTQQVEALLARFPAQDKLIVITDIFTGSVNNEFVRLLSRPHFHLLSGLDLPSTIDLLISATEENTEKLITKALTSAKENIQYCNQTIVSAMTMDKDF